MSIEVKQLSKLYGTQRAVNNISFSVNKGEIVGFLGPNGAGKSTTMKILTSFIPPSEGGASICGFDVEQSPYEVKKRIGYLPENNPLYTDMYVKEYLQFVARVQGLGRKGKDKVKEMIEVTGLEVEQKKKIGQLSKGYRQRVGLAQAMIHDPEVLILDEPTTGLDPNQLADIRQLISRLGEEKTVLLSTHIMQEVQAMCNRVIIINRGNIVADDRTQTLQQSANRQLYTVEYNKTIDLQKLADYLEETEIEPFGQNMYRIYSEQEEDKRPMLFNFAVENGLVLLALNREESSLEEVFRELTGS